MAGRRPGPLTQEGKRGPLPSQSVCSPQSRHDSHRHLEERHTHPYNRVRRAHRAQTLRPSALRSPRPGGKPESVEHPFCIPARGDPSWSPGRCFCPPGREWAVEHGRQPGPEPHEDRARTAGAPRRPLLAPGCRLAPPQHQGSREALPRHRLSLRCQALWMRLRASLNFLLEASWMALWGRSTW